MDPVEKTEVSDDPFEKNLLAAVSLRIKHAASARTLGSLADAEQSLRFAVAELGDAITSLGNSPHPASDAVAKIVGIPAETVKGISAKLAAHVPGGHESYTLALLVGLHQLAHTEEEWSNLNMLVKQVSHELPAISKWEIRTGLLGGAQGGLVNRLTPSLSPNGAEVVQLSQHGAKFIADLIG